MNTKLARLLLAIGFLLWLTFVVAAFYVVQKPAFLQVVPGVAATAWTLTITLVLVVEAAAIGHWILGKLRLPAMTEVEQLLLGTGTGLGIFGLTGFGLAAAGLAKPVLLLALLGGSLAWLIWRRQIPAIYKIFRLVRHTWKETSREMPAWVWGAVMLALLLIFLLALATPAEAFDALLYHLAVPAMWLKAGGLQLVNMPHYWFPQLVEGIFAWPMALGSDRAPQLIHFTFGLLTALLLGNWSRQLWGNRAAAWVPALLLTMPSLPWLAAWAYTDLALCYYALAVLYTVWKWRNTGSNRWLVSSGIMAGFAMGVKYTSFLVPLTALLFILWSGRRELRAALVRCLLFSSLAILVALPWYARNLIWTGNPFYPFIFGGPFWDAFRAQAYSATGTGTGWNLSALLLLPLNVTLGVHDANFYDGRIGPSFLLLFPLALWTLWLARRETPARQSALILATGFAGISILAWTYGIIQTSSLWQSRLLLPGLMPFMLVLAAGIGHLKRLDTARLKISFCFSAVIGVFVLVSLLDFGLQVAYRNPLMAAVGGVTRQAYIARLQPGYAAAMELVQQTPSNAYVYFLYEPRSYGMARRVQPDPINDNWSHDLYLHGSVAATMAAWRMQGYTYVLLSRTGADFIAKTIPAQAPSLDPLMNALRLVAKSPGDEYELYEIPAH
jgi:4-amino-4-deoxy-L-arabinose transferase-like glycosyltransferase